MTKREITRTSKIIIHSGKDLDPEISNLIEEAKKATQQAYAPYSMFWVGAALKLSNGLIIRGNNQENAAYPSGLCAERVACFSAKSQFPEEDIEMIAIVAKNATADHFKLATPCGSCRQTMSEYENHQKKPIRLFLLNTDGEVYESDSIENLLPFKFSEENLKND
ncbi:cytidine deaminase [Roseivirga sp.]|uniref:cytidine deaminase n=1 Tax=Roseivirga sp. TaxID=1964215 RepID=UPI003B51803F